MKFAARISSMRRSAWKQWRSCSADSDSKCRGLAGEVGAGGMDPLAFGLEHDGSRDPGRATRSPDRCAGGAAPGRSPGRAGHGRARSARRRRAPGAGRRCDARWGRAVCAAARRLLGEVAQRDIDLDRACGGAPDGRRRRIVSSRAPASRASARPSARWRDQVRVPMDHEHRALEAPRRLAELARDRESAHPASSRSASPGRSPAPSRPRPRCPWWSASPAGSAR